MSESDDPKESGKPPQEDAIGLGTRNVKEDAEIRGRMFLYRDPQVLTREEHGGLGLSAVPDPYRFAASARALPLVTTELRSVQKFHPIIFADPNDPQPLAVLGLVEDVNLFVDGEGQWLVPGYIPAYLRCHPLTLATAPDDKLAVIFDGSAPTVSDAPEHPFFDGEDLSPEIRQRVEFCQNYRFEQQRTGEFSEKLKELNLLRPQVLDVQGERLAEYYAVDPNRLEQLPADTLVELFREGFLTAIIAHLFSLDNWPELLRLRSLRTAQAEGASAS